MINERTFEHIPLVPQPKELKVQLYQHQRASVHQMEEREKTQRIIQNDTVIDTNISVNADKTGFGKTLAMVTLIHRDKMKWDMETTFDQSVIKTYAGGRIKMTKTISYEKLDVTLVLVSQSIIHQWYDECHKTPLSVKMITSRKLVETVMIENYDVILVTPTMYNKLVSKYFGMAWKRFIFDEPGHLKVPAMNRIITGFTWLVTATPNAIAVKHRNCRNSFMYDIIGSTGWVDFDIQFAYMIVKNDDDFIKHSFEMPPTNHIFYKCYNPIYKAVSGLVTPNIKQMISAGNIKGAIKSLGGGETKNIAELVRQKKIFERDELESRLSVYIVKNKKKQITIVTLKISRINSQLIELQNRYDEMLKGDCSICFSSISDPVMEPNCQNIFCGKCLLKWLENANSCPLCRDSIVSKDLIYIDMKESKTDAKRKIEPKQVKTKINTTISLIKNNPKGRFIIFSAWDRTFSSIRTQLTVHDISFIEVKGGVNKREKNIKSFKSGHIQVIFLNSRFNGAGINLQESSDIIVYHRMDNSTLNQIIGRANRIGRIESLNVHHLQI
jgi:SNF2 family DNA or RNA helicase